MKRNLLFQLEPWLLSSRPYNEGAMRDLLAATNPELLATLSSLDVVDDAVDDSDDGSGGGGGDDDARGGEGGGLNGVPGGDVIKSDWHDQELKSDWQVIKDLS